MQFITNKPKKGDVQDIKPFKVEDVHTINGNKTMRRRASYTLGPDNVVKHEHYVGPSKKAKKTDKRGKSLRYFKKLRGFWNSL